MDGKKKDYNSKKNRVYLNLLVKEEKKQKKKSTELLNFKNNLCHVITNLKCYITVV